MDSKQKMIVGLLVVAIVFSVATLAMTFSIDVPSVKFNAIKGEDSIPKSNVVITIESPLEESDEI